jgi:hypothetical protein
MTVAGVLVGGEPAGGITYRETPIFFLLCPFLTVYFGFYVEIYGLLLPT